jgi:Mg2+/Co2+ transporter CorB
MASTTDSQATTKGSAPRFAFGVVLFVLWGLATIVWVASTISLAADGDAGAVVTAVVALALLAVLFGMEGLEVAVIDRWRVIYPDRPTSHLAAWLAARQLFVALIVTTATILINRKELTVPFTSVSIDEGAPLKIFDIVWTGFTVLWLAQIFPKHLAATNPDRYLHYLRRSLFPVVEVVRRIGVSQPGEWVASAVERRLNWPLTEAEQMQEAVAPQEESLASIWRQLTPESPPQRGAGGQRTEGSKQLGVE